MRFGLGILLILLRPCTFVGLRDLLTVFNILYPALILEDLDFADDIALLSSRYVDKEDKTSRLVEEAT